MPPLPDAARSLAHTPDFDLSNENVSLVRISAAPGKVGIIRDANVAALKVRAPGCERLL